jgi:hypothetical protein
MVTYVTMSSCDAIKQMIRGIKFLVPTPFSLRVDRGALADESHSTLGSKQQRERVAGNGVAIGVV